MNAQELWNLSYALEERANFMVSDKERQTRLFAASCEIADLALAVQRGGTIETVLGVSLVAESAEVVAAQDGSELTGNSDLPVDFERINLYA